MVLRAALVGFLLWLAATAVFHFLGPMFFYPDTQALTPLLVGAAPLMAGLTFLAIKLLRVSPGDEAEAAIALAFPGMLLDVFVVRAFGDVFPALDPTLDGTFGALLLLGYAAMLFTGLLMTRLSPADQRL